LDTAVDHVDRDTGAVAAVRFAARCHRGARIPEPAGRRQYVST
jgi:hypothetical protein